jgi:hypothetical protein
MSDFPCNATYFVRPFKIYTPSLKRSYSRTRLERFFVAQALAQDRILGSGAAQTCLLDTRLKARIDLPEFFGPRLA